jgi:2-C-methyl-D-erythritol 4-phosphate cytidylyltransferase
MPNYHAIILAAGGGTRMGASIPKQYLQIAGKPILFYTIDILSKHTEINKIFVLLSPNDEHFKEYDWTRFGNNIIPLYCGGNTRAETVLNALNATSDIVATDDWILVHDAVRPCLDLESITKLIDEVKDDPVGGILAIPVVDTLKRANTNLRAAVTQPREHLWRAQTPQMFKYQLLLKAHLAVDPNSVTDEASVIEQLGLESKLVMGTSYNIKVTYPDDLIVTENNLRYQNRIGDSN